MANGNSELKAPYVSWSRLEGFLKPFKENGVPLRIDATLMKGRSGTEQSQIRGAMRFLKLVTGDDDSTTDRCREVVRVLGTDEWPAVAAQLVLEYAPIVKDVDLEHATQGQLNTAFRERGSVGGSVLDKAVRLYLTLRDQAGLPSSNHFTPRAGTPTAKSANGGSGPARTRVKRARKPETAGGTPDAPPPADMSVLVCSIPGGKSVKMWLPQVLTDKEIAFVQRYLKDYMGMLKQASGEPG